MYTIAAEAEGVGVFKTHHIGSTRPTVYLHVPKRLAGNLQTGKKYLVTINSVQERRDYNVTKTSHGPTVRVFKTNMELMGFRPARGIKQKIVVEFRGMNVTRPAGASEKRLFTTYKLGSTQVDLRVGRLGAKPGDVFEFNQIRQFDIGDFAREFNAHKSQILRNVTMFFRPRSLLLRVDGKKIALTQPRLTTNKLEVALRADIGRTKKPIKFQFDGEKILPRFLQDWPIHKMKASPYGFEIDYSLSKNNARSFRLNFDKFNRAHLLGRLKLLSAPDNVEGTYRVEADHFLHECVRFRIASASGRSYDEFRYEKGDISEEIQRYLLDMTGLWEEVAYHPFENGWRAHESRKTGPDSLQRFKVSGELYYFEFKWDQHWELTHQVARHQAMKYIIERPRYESEKIAGAYIGILHWDTAANKLKLHVSRVWPPNQDGRGTHEML